MHKFKITFQLLFPFSFIDVFYRLPFQTACVCATTVYFRERERERVKIEIKIIPDGISKVNFLIHLTVILRLTISHPSTRSQYIFFSLTLLFPAFSYTPSCLSFFSFTFSISHLNLHNNESFFLILWVFLMFCW